MDIVPGLGLLNAFQVKIPFKWLDSLKKETYKSFVFFFEILSH